MPLRSWVSLVEAGMGEWFRKADINAPPRRTRITEDDEIIIARIFEALYKFMLKYSHPCPRVIEDSRNSALNY
jgi:hypothetical protein